MWYNEGVMSLMLEKLHESEAELPFLLDNLEEWDNWQGLNVLYHDPQVERVWRQWGDFRISLHVIHPAEKVDCLYHPHPWASAMRIVHGGYEMGVGFGKGLETPPEACRLILTAGSEYVMEHPDAWHYVRPVDSLNLSVMVSSKPWEREMPITPAKGENIPLSSERKWAILNMFSLFYPSKTV